MGMAGKKTKTRGNNSFYFHFQPSGNEIQSNYPLEILFLHERRKLFKTGPDTSLPFSCRKLFFVSLCPKASKNVHVFLPSTALYAYRSKTDTKTMKLSLGGVGVGGTKAPMRGGKSISIVAQTLSGSLGSAQPFGMSPGRERRRRPSKQIQQLTTVKRSF